MAATTTHIKHIEVRLVGVDIAPGRLRSKEVAEIIIAVEEMVAAVVEQENPDFKAEQVRIGLSEISAGSMTMFFEPNLEDLTIPAAESVMKAIDTQDFNSMPAGTMKALRSLKAVTGRYDARIQFRTQNGSSVLHAEMTPQTVIPEPVYLSGETVIYGDVLRVGGAEPKVQFRSIDNELIYCDATREITRQVASRLYEQVGLRGQAMWDLETGGLKSFVVEDILEYEDAGLVQAFTELREIIGGYFDEVVDVDAFVDELRSDER